MSPIPSRAQILQWQELGDVLQVRRAVRGLRRRYLKRCWIEFGNFLGNLLSPLLLGLVYCTLFLPFGLIGRLHGGQRGWRPTQRNIGSCPEDLQSTA